MIKHDVMRCLRKLIGKSVYEVGPVLDAAGYRWQQTQYESTFRDYNGQPGWFLFYVDKGIDGHNILDVRLQKWYK